MSDLSISEPTGFRQALQLSQEARVLGIRLHTADALHRVPDEAWRRLTAQAKGAYDGRVALAVQLGDPAALDGAIEDVALYLRRTFPDRIDSLAARTIAAGAIGTWMTSMSVLKGARS